ncbi:hypothetical protein P153DRAFT_373883 [Dothidotthia symphoricarpi CBS 119687]|uniref:C6 transcription factor-like protein RegA n=1 Tax=Dothidotthia symphoricarpi CBS 119687 TaxID=1392245 RepID=A0A6A6AME7_9PLEO|nr:uncharacterized protein P153DRAFT_373883 [Dothidotthia symphoricarpi CBS 119687]KAF2132057.1 hypothetical protein P153DRAFT_373883 [Dothidotthia symphoricarpi CBS 119687]
MAMPSQDQLAAPTTDPDQAARLFQCSTCKRSFTRADHLTRHVRAHTKAKPYVCPVCSKGFARIDLLKRHVSNHDSSSTNKRQRREIARDTRVVQACEACSQSHLRCEDDKPCSRCKKKNIPCQVPEVSTMDDNESNELDAVHAAQDLLGLSTGFEYPSTMPNMDENVTQPSTLRLSTQNTPLTLVMGVHHPQDHITFPSTTSTVHGNREPSRTLEQGDRERSSIMSNNAVPRDSIVLNQPYTGDAADHQSFFDGPDSSFGNTPSIDPFLPEHFRNMPPFEAYFSGQATPRGIMDLSFDLDIGLTDIDLGLLDQYNFQIPFTAGTPSTDAQGLEQQLSENDNAPVRSEAFKQSIWRYLPQRNQNYVAQEQHNLAFADAHKDNGRRAHITQRRVVAEKLNRSSRDRLLALVLGACGPANVQRIASAFPSVELLDSLIQYFLTSPSIDAQSWFHLPTFSPSKLSPHLLACTIATAAATTPDVPLRKLGFAMHEAARIALSSAFEYDNTAIRDFDHVRIFLVELELGMWSGISRKMEIAESFFQALLTMLRRGGRFRRSTWKELLPVVEDQGAELETKWQEWVGQECFLRMVYRTFELDRQSSMALLKPPLISYAEMQLPLPSSNLLWHAKSAVAWKSVHLGMVHNIMKRPSAIDCLSDLDHLARHESASTTYLYMMWGMIWEYRQMSALSAKSSSQTNNNLILSSRYQELVKKLEDFRVSSLHLSKSAEMTMELMLVHLNAPLDDIQLFAGIEGQEEARCAYPILRDWIKTDSARQALWHAGQILRAAESLPKALLCNFNAVAVYHAGLILWGYGFLKRLTSNELTPNSTPQAVVILNGTDSLSARRFITMDRGLPSIRSPTSQATTQLSDVCGVMDGLVRLLRAPHDTIEECPPLVGNLVQLLEGLRIATK